jgi:hypothetical protein
VDNPKIFLCPFDSSKGKEGGKPPKCADQFEETDEPGDPARPDEHPLSYFYEFSGADCSWDWRFIGEPPYPNDAAYFDTDNDGHVSWGEVKWKQLQFGDSTIDDHDIADTDGDGRTYQDLQLKGYPKSLFPILRCFWHQENPDSNAEHQILNLSFEGKPFFSGPKWEETSEN